MMENFKLLKRIKFRGGPVTVLPGDKLAVTLTDNGQTTELVSHKIQEGEGGTYDEAAVFEGLFEGRKVLGGLIMEQETTEKDTWQQ